MLSMEKPVDLKKCQQAPLGIGLAEPEECPLLQTAMRKDREGLLDL